MLTGLRHIYHSIFMIRYEPERDKISELFFCPKISRNIKSSRPAYQMKVNIRLVLQKFIFQMQLLSFLGFEYISSIMVNGITQRTLTCCIPSKMAQNRCLGGTLNPKLKRLHPIRPKTIRPKKAHSTEKKVEQKVLLIAKQTVPTLPLTQTDYCNDLHGFKIDYFMLWLLKLA